MTRVLSGLQPSGQLHLGNYAGAISQFLEAQKQNDMFVFVASYHAMTSQRDPAALRANINQVVVDYLAFGLDPKQCHIYLQQDVPAVTELAWILSCLCPKHLMDKGVSFKDKVAHGLAANIGLYTYPILQAADILYVDPDVVPVGKDQKQNVEIARDLAAKFNHAYGETFRIPDYKEAQHAAVVPGIDGEKMSKSYGNIIDPFMDEKPLRKRIMKIVADGKSMEEPKDPDSCTTFQIFRAIAGPEDQRTLDLADKYRAGNFGYGHAKQELFELLLDHFGPARVRRQELMNDPSYIQQVLADGAAAANQAGEVVMQKVRAAVGL